MATHSSIIAQRIPWTEEPGGCPWGGRVEHNWETFFWVSLIAQVVKNPPAMQETLILFLGWEVSLEKG